MSRKIKRENDGWIYSNGKREAYGKSAEIRANFVKCCEWLVKSMSSELMLDAPCMYGDLRCPARYLHIYLPKLSKERTSYTMKTEISLSDLTSDLETGNDEQSPLNKKACREIYGKRT